MNERIFLVQYKGPTKPMFLWHSSIGLTQLQMLYGKFNIIANLYIRVNPKVCEWISLSRNFNHLIQINLTFNWNFHIERNAEQRTGSFFHFHSHYYFLRIVWGPYELWAGQLRLGKDALRSYGSNSKYPSWCVHANEPVTARNGEEVSDWLMFQIPYWVRRNGKRQSSRRPIGEQWLQKVLVLCAEY